MKTKHTPGPWHVEKHQRFIPHEISGPGGSFEGINTWFNLIVAEDPLDPKLRTPIAELSVSTESDANAKLIAAAPELLEALRECITEDGAIAWRGAEEAGRRLEAISNIARKAISKATS